MKLNIHQQLEAYFKEVAAALNLQAWRIYLAAEEAEDDVDASIHTVSGTRRAMIKLAPDWRRHDADEFRRIITHELLHLTHHDTDDNIKQLLYNEAALSSSITNLILTQLYLDLERMVDHLSLVIAASMPAWQPIFPLPDTNPEQLNV